MTASTTLAAAAAIALSVAVAGCDNAPEHGVVTDKGHTAAWIQFLPGTLMCSGNPVICTQMPQQMIPWPESWSLTITNGDESGDTGVNQGVYDRCDMGEVWPQCGQQ